jgi:WhiB family redox-sensing transcriptional regulator
MNWSDPQEPPGEWADEAACRNHPDKLFFPEQNESAAPAKRICATCPVLQQCFDYATASKEKYGVWGGESQQERRERITGRPSRGKRQRARLRLEQQAAFSGLEPPPPPDYRGGQVEPGVAVKSNRDRWRTEQRLAVGRRIAEEREQKIWRLISEQSSGDAAQAD